MRIKIAPVFLLDEPHYHRFRPGEVNRFRGLVLAIDAGRIETLEAGARTIPVDVPSPDVASFVHLPAAERCRFDFEMRDEGPFAFAAGGQSLFRYEPPSQPLPPLDVAMPPPELIAVTQGGGNVDSYRDSILSGLTTMRALLDHDPRSILDIGCGTGRMLLGWWADDGTRRLAGTDINPDLIEWNRRHLPDVADWSVNGIDPPLPFADDSFDCVQLISVFTHLPLHRQRAWTAEVRRLLRRGGSAIVTLHGAIYARLLLDDALRHQLELDGHLSVAGAAEGANAFSAFHTERFARELFEGFAVTFYERGPRNLFPIASLQDVYVLKKL